MWHLFEHFSSWSEIFVLLLLLCFINFFNNLVVFLIHLLFTWNIFIIFVFVFVLHGLILLFVHHDFFMFDFSVLLFRFLFGFLFLHFSHCQHVHNSFLLFFFVLVKKIDVNKFVCFFWGFASFKLLGIFPKFDKSFISFKFGFELFEFLEDFL